MMDKITLSYYDFKTGHLYWKDKHPKKDNSWARYLITSFKEFIEKRNIILIRKSKYNILKFIKKGDEYIVYVLPVDEFIDEKAKKVNKLNYMRELKTFI